MKSATVIIPTTGNKDVLMRSVGSVIIQNHPATCYVVCDGKKFEADVQYFAKHVPSVAVAYLPINVGANGFYGHRIYAAFTHLVNTDYVLYLDQDNSFTPDHIESCISKIKEKGWDWCYSLRRICDVKGNRLLDDNCESLGLHIGCNGYHHVDTNCYCIKTEVAIKLAQSFHGGWGADRVFYQTLSKYFPNYGCSGKYTVNYCLGGNPGSVTKEFFEIGNNMMKHNVDSKGEYPWQKNL